MTVHPAQPPEAAADPLAALSADERRLALLGLCDFEGQWDVLEAATRLVVDGEAKAALIRRLTLQADQLAALAKDEAIAYQLWIARRWFATQFCRDETAPAPTKPRTRSRPKSAHSTRHIHGGTHD